MGLPGVGGEEGQRQQVSSGVATRAGSGTSAAIGRGARTVGAGRSRP